MGAAASIQDGGSAESLALNFERNHLPDIAEVVRTQSITYAELEPALSSRKALVAFFSTRNCDLSKAMADEILKLNRSPDQFLGAGGGGGGGSGGAKANQAEAHSPTNRHHKSPTNQQEQHQQSSRTAAAAAAAESAPARAEGKSPGPPESKDGDSEGDVSGEGSESPGGSGGAGGAGGGASAKAGGGGGSVGAAGSGAGGLEQQLKELDLEMNTVATYSESQEVLQRWCLAALAAGNVEHARALVQRNSVLMGYMKDDVAVALSLEAVRSGSGGVPAARRLLGLVEDRVKASAVLREQVEAAVKAGDRPLAKTLCSLLPDDATRERVLASLDAEDCTPLVKEALYRGDYARGLEIARSSKLSGRVVEDMVEDAVLQATAAGDPARVEEGLGYFPEGRVAVMATRALGNCSGADMFKMLLSHAVDKSASADDKVGDGMGRGGCCCM
jgi:hypothetical protein